MTFPEGLLPLINTPHTHNKLKGGRGGGKSFTVGGFLAHVMVQTPIQILCCREVQKSLRESSYALLKKMIFSEGLADQFNFIESKGVIESKAGARAVFTGLLQHTVDSLKSYEGFHWAWIEEAHSVSARSLETLIPTLRQDGYFALDLGDGVQRVFPLRMFIYTLNPFSWSDPVDMVLPSSRDDVQEITINYDKNPYFPKSLDDERKEQKETLSPEEYDRIWRGIPFDDGERGIFTRTEIEEAMSRKVSRDGDHVASADIARFGSDKTVFFKREGLQVIDGPICYSKMSTQDSARRLNDFGAGGAIVLDDTGVGGGVTDKLHDMDPYKEALFTEVVPINFAAGAGDKEKYKDIISEMWFNLKDIIDEVGLPDDQRLKKELLGRNYRYLPDGRRKVESKEEYKKRTGQPSPDYADSLILLYYTNNTFAMASY